jgi:hypothetical protein
MKKVGQELRIQGTRANDNYHRSGNQDAEDQMLEFSKFYGGKLLHF